ncbi:hypothetical protein [Chromobacterium vaccinii]|uniref:hypothetical protein n=1 Tax=Chromobacterium vaccinii TaxID=1108595 RepID=UPI0011AB5459|nr:hypothetical protein [Chromobacterium vaccinii]
MHAQRSGARLSYTPQSLQLSQGASKDAHAERITICYSFSNNILGVPGNNNLLSNRSMESKEFRRANLLALIEQYGTIRHLAEKVDVAPNHLSLVKNHVRNMGDKLARRIEEAVGKPVGWMDLPHDGGDLDLAQDVASVTITAQSEEELVKLLREKGEAYAFELLRKAFMEQENKKGD